VPPLEEELLEELDDDEDELLELLLELEELDDELLELEDDELEELPVPYTSNS
jgi:hypothetical protein